MTKYLQKIHADFRLFVYLIWKHLGLPDPTPIQYDIAHYLQHSPRRILIEAYRGVGKSFLTAAYVLWRLLLNAQIKCLVVSASKERADSFSLFTKKLIDEVPILRHLKPREDQRKSIIAYDVAPALPDQSPSVKSMGLFGQIVGSRADLLIADDIETPINSATQQMRAKISDLVKEFDAIIKPLKTSKIVYLGTPQLADSLYNVLPERGYQRRIWTSRYPSNVDVYNGDLADICINDDKIDEPTDPSRFDEQELQERAISYGKSGFALQFQLDTSLNDAFKYPLQVKDLIVHDLNTNIAPSKIIWGSDASLVLSDLPNLAFNKDYYHKPYYTSSDDLTEYTGSVMSIDPSGRGKDETSYSILKILNGYLFLIDCFGLTGGYDQITLERLATLAQTHLINEIVIEENFGDGMFKQLLQPVVFKKHKCVISEVKQHKQKEHRIIDTLEPVMSGHRLVINKSIIIKDYQSVMATESDLTYSLIHQMTRITRERGSLIHDDRLDSLAIAVQYWNDSMATDRDRAVEKHQERLLNAELKKFKNHVIGYKHKKASAFTLN